MMLLLLLLLLWRLAGYQAAAAGWVLSSVRKLQHMWLRNCSSTAHV
jgi:hypothetical protein